MDILKGFCNPGRVSEQVSKIKESPLIIKISGLTLLHLFSLQTVFSYADSFVSGLDLVWIWMTFMVNDTHWLSVCTLFFSHRKLEGSCNSLQRKQMSRNAPARDALWLQKHCNIYSSNVIHATIINTLDQTKSMRRQWIAETKGCSIQRMVCK